MILLGLILILAALGAGVFVYYSTDTMTNRVDLDALGVSIGLTPLQLVLFGALVVVTLWLGLVLLRRGTARSRRRRRERREEAERAEEQRLQAEREAEQRLEEQRLATETARQRAEAAESRAESLARESAGTASTDPAPYSSSEYSSAEPVSSSSTDPGYETGGDPNAGSDPYDARRD